MYIYIGFWKRISSRQKAIQPIRAKEREGAPPNTTVSLQKHKRTNNQTNKRTSSFSIIIHIDEKNKCLRGLELHTLTYRVGRLSASFRFVVSDCFSVKQNHIVHPIAKIRKAGICPVAVFVRHHFRKNYEKKLSFKLLNTKNVIIAWGSFTIKYLPWVATALKIANRGH